MDRSFNCQCCQPRTSSSGLKRMEKKGEKKGKRRGKKGRRIKTTLVMKQPTFMKVHYNSYLVFHSLKSREVPNLLSFSVIQQPSTLRILRQDGCVIVWNFFELWAANRLARWTKVPMPHDVAGEFMASCPESHQVRCDFYVQPRQVYIRYLI